MLSDDVAQFVMGEFTLSGEGAGVFLERLPDTPDRAVAIYTRGGGAPNANVDLRRHQVQVIVRDAGDDARGGYALAKLVYDLVHACAPNAPLAPESERVLLCRALQMPYGIGRDNKGRLEWTINFEITTNGEN